MAAYGKVEVSLDRRDWRPTPLVEQSRVVALTRAATQGVAVTSSWDEVSVY